ncbi:cell wall-active antibiotics response protein LiaF [Paenibacillus sp. IHBB 10380]|uniref:cell wall-active antibiotics response protein LiaF n=1 Tax=Paenibacillus sp. IHBB 10380 TaxID=1566358 RepID=UPI0006982B42|nr:cell wall-active antibiotics response protein LiaF [Paenibacillus sp. IHBB 10380]
MKRGWLDRIFGGVVLIGIGTIFLLQQMNIVNISIGSIISTYWPLILVYMGFKNLVTSHDEKGSFLGGFIMIAVGGYFQSRALGWIGVSPGDFFRSLIPAVLIICGVYVILKPRRVKRSKHMEHPIKPDVFPPNPSELPETPTESTLDQQFEEKFGISFADEKKEQAQEAKDRHRRESEAEEHRRYSRYEDTKGFDSREKVNKSTFIGDVHMGRDYFELKPTNVSQFIGDTVIDLTNAQIPYGKTKINISAFIGDIKVYVPDDMDLGVKVNSSSFIGDMSVLSESRSGFISSIQSSTPYFREAQKKVIINVSAFIGDIKVTKVG